MEPEIIEEVPVEETPVVEEAPVVEDVPVVEETPVVVEPTNTPDYESLSFTITNTRENLIVIAKDRGYQDVVLRPDYTIDMPLEDRFIPNPVDAIAWLNNHIKDFLSDVASKPFIEARRLAKQAEIDAEASAVRSIARQSIS